MNVKQALEELNIYPLCESPRGYYISLRAYFRLNLVYPCITRKAKLANSTALVFIPKG